MALAVFSPGARAVSGVLCGLTGRMAAPTIGVACRTGVLGSKTAIGEGMSYTISAGHDAWVDNDPFVGLEVTSAEEYEKPKS